jgi:hypothetical protein
MSNQSIASEKDKAEQQESWRRWDRPSVGERK